MSITDELRKYATNDSLHYCSDYLAIADRIDAEHEEAIQREHESAYDVGYAEGMGVANKADMRAEYLRGKNDGYDEGWDAAVKTMTERMVELPKDADDEPINVGDELDYLEALHPDVPSRFKVQDMFYSGNGEWRLRAYPATYKPEKCRHYHAPTVEDVLTEFGIDWEHESDCEDRAALLKEYATKLRLANNEE